MAVEAAVAPIITVSPSPAFYIALVVYIGASLLYVSAFVDAPKWMARAARIAMAMAFVAHAADISWRAFQHVHPGTSVREALGFLSWVMVGGFLFWSRKISLALLGAFVAPAALALLAVARLSPSGEAMIDLTVLGRVHISLATLGVAIFSLATAVAVMYLAQERVLKRKQFDRVLLKRGAALETLDRLSHRLVVIGFPIFTVAMMLGVIWVSRRGSGFDRLEYPVSLITWLAFGGLIVTRTAVGWRGRKAALLTIAGFGAAMIVLGMYLARRAMGA